MGWKCTRRWSRPGDALKKADPEWSATRNVALARYYGPVSRGDQTRPRSPSTAGLLRTLRTWRNVLLRLAKTYENPERVEACRANHIHVPYRGRHGRGLRMHQHMTSAVQKSDFRRVHRPPAARDSAGYQDLVPHAEQADQRRVDFAVSFMDPSAVTGDATAS